VNLRNCGWKAVKTKRTNFENNGVSVVKVKGKPVSVTGIEGP
jgi:hypothetical protein